MSKAPPHLSCGSSICQLFDRRIHYSATRAVSFWKDSLYFSQVLRFLVKQCVSGHHASCTSFPAPFPALVVDRYLHYRLWRIQSVNRGKWTDTNWRDGVHHIDLANINSGGRIG